MRGNRGTMMSEGRGTDLRGILGTEESVMDKGCAVRFVDYIARFSTYIVNLSTIIGEISQDNPQISSPQT